MADHEYREPQCKHCGGVIVKEGSWNGAYYKHADHSHAYDHEPEMGRNSEDG